MKKLFVIICSLFVGIANADNVITSKEYVDTQGATLQPQVQAKNTNTVLTYPAAGTDTPGEKAIYDASAAYATQSDALVTAGQFNNALQVALDTEFVCVSRNDQGCLLYEIHSASQKQTLPAGYTQLEYIESTRTQYIDTGIPGTDLLDVDGASMRLKLAFTDFDAPTNSTSFYANGLGDNPQIGLALRDGKGYWQNFNTGNEELTLNAIYEPTVDFKTGVLSCDGFSDVVARRVTQTSNNCLLFAANKVGIATYFANQRLYSAIITGVGGTVLRKFIPARRDSDGVLGMYDTVSGTFFTNSGTGTFIAGPVFSYLPQGN